MRDVAHVADSNPPQRNVVRMDGRRAVLMTVLKSGSVSTLNIVDDVKALLPRLRETLPKSLKILPVADQSIFVRAAISGVVREGAIAAALTALMILLFLGSWRSTLIIVISIPLAILFSIALLSATGQTLNIMTLGGLALAVGILVDDATVTTENINWHLEKGKSVPQAILDGAQQIVVPAFVSFLCICIAFVPMFFLPGVSGFLFAPMAMAVVFGLFGSFILSRTLVNTLASYFLVAHGDARTWRWRAATMHARAIIRRNPLVRFQHGFEKRFEKVRSAYHALSRFRDGAPRAGLPRAFWASCCCPSCWCRSWARISFPPWMPERFRFMCARRWAPASRRPRPCSTISRHRVRQVIPPNQLSSIVDNIDLPVSGTNRAYINTGSVGPEDGDILISLNENHAPTADYVKTLRTVLPRSFPGSTFSFLPADIVSQILNFGSPAPIDVVVAGPDKEKDEAYATELVKRIAPIPGAVDVRLEQSSHYPAIRRQCGPYPRRRSGHQRTRRDQFAGRSILPPASRWHPPSGSIPRTACPIPVVIQTPQYRLDTLGELKNLPITSAKAGNAAAAGRHQRHSSRRYRRGGVALRHPARLRRLCHHPGARPGRASRLTSSTCWTRPGAICPGRHGHHRAARSQTMNEAFSGLFFGLAEAVVLIYLLMVVNFHSWSDPFVIIMALPAALAGIAWTLFATHTTLSVPALTGAIMCMGVATANSVLVVSFARERLAETGDAVRAAIDAGVTRFRPGADDGAGDDHWHGAHGAGHGRGRRTERAAGPRRNRRSVVRHLRDLVLRAGPVRDGARPQSARAYWWRGPCPRRMIRRQLQVDPAHVRMTLSAPRSLAGCVLGVIVAIGTYARFSQASSVASWTRKDDIPTVALISPIPSRQEIRP